MKVKNVMLFSYDFPHKKTQDFILRLLIEDYKIKYIIAAPWIKLNTSPSSSFSFTHNGISHPKLISETFKIPYFVMEHNSLGCANFIKKNPVDIHIISGARILDKKIIESSKNKILNIHPGLLPQVRGLDTLQWSIYFNQPIGITAHFIGNKIDLGRVVYKEMLEIYRNDTIKDVSLRMLERQNDVLIESLKKLEKIRYKDLTDLDSSSIKYNTKMPKKIEEKVIKEYKKWVIKNSK